jgi:hypothetical protein
VALYLTAAGVGRIELWATTERGVADLQRGQHDLATLNADTTVQVDLLDAAATPSFPGAIVCADVTLATLVSINQGGLRQRRPLMAGASRTPARIALYAGHESESPCAACDPQPPVCSESEHAGDATCGLIGSVLALEAIKLSLALPGSRTGWALLYDPRTLRISESPVAKRLTCRACAVNA